MAASQRLTRNVRSSDLRLAKRRHGWQTQHMNATLTVDDAGQINLPEAVKRVFGVEPGARLRVEVTADRIEIVRDIPVVAETARSSSGRLVLARTGIVTDAGRAVREERDALADRALRK
jgi:AbrB family looped-hinge helix DNA binding protein